MDVAGSKRINITAGHRIETVVDTAAGGTAADIHDFYAVVCVKRFRSDPVDNLFGVNRRSVRRTQVSFDLIQLHNGIFSPAFAII